MFCRGCSSECNVKDVLMNQIVGLVSFFHLQSFPKPVSFFVEPKWNTTLIFFTTNQDWQIPFQIQRCPEMKHSLFMSNAYFELRWSLQNLHTQSLCCPPALYPISLYIFTESIKMG